MARKPQVLAGGILFLIAVVLAACIPVLLAYSQGTLLPVVLGGSGRPTPTPPPTPAPEWINLGLVGEPISDIATSQGTIFVATNGYDHGVFKSDNLGNTWRTINNGLTGFDLLQIEAAAENKEVLYAITQNNFWRSNDGGVAWYVMNPTTDSCLFKNGTSIMGVLSNDGSRILVMCSDNFAISEDGGRQWEGEYIHDLAQIDCSFLASLRPAPLDKRIVYFFNVAICRFLEGEIQLLAGAGPNLSIYDLAVSYEDANLLFAGTNGGVYTSVDGGLYWTPINNTLPDQGLALDCRSILASPWSGSQVFALCDGIIFQSSDLGITWTQLDGPEDVTFLHAMEQPALLLAASSEDGLWGLDYR